jgi:hypothetical protein
MNDGAAQRVGRVLEVDGIGRQAVSEILPDGNKEKQLVQGLLNQKEQLAEAQARLF